MGLRSFAFYSPFSVTAFVIFVTVNTVGAATHAAERPGGSDPVSSGRATYRQFCAPCHGTDGKGYGPIASVLLKAPADVTQIRRRHNGAFPQADLEAMLLAPNRTVAPRTMPANMVLWGPIFLSMDSDPALARARVADLLAFVESIQEK